MHDDLYVRAGYFRHGDAQVVFLSFDVLFFSRVQADRIIVAVGAALALPADAILLNTTHTHTGPMLDGGWAWADVLPPDTVYAQRLEQAAVTAAVEARAQARLVTLWAGTTRSMLPMNRRRPEGGDILFAPNPQGDICDTLPVCLARDDKGTPVLLLFSVACHPSTTHESSISADYPGMAMQRIDAHLGAPVSMFLQGCAGDAKPAILAAGNRWRSGTWDDIAEAGRIVADAVIAALTDSLHRVEPDIRTHRAELSLPLGTSPDRITLQAIADDAGRDEIHRRWADTQLSRLDRGQRPLEHVAMRLHGVKLGEGLVAIGLQAEPVAAMGHLIEAAYPNTTVFSLGYTDGMTMYLPTSAMLAEGGYEVVSYWEYGYPAALQSGLEDRIVAGLGQLRAAGIA